MMVVAGLVFGAVATAATQDGLIPDEKVGVCHATGDAENPYVFLVVADDSFEHAHHRQHGGDFFRAADAFDCGSDVPTEVSQDNATSALPDDDSTVATPDEVPAELPDNATTEPQEVEDDAVENATEDNVTEAPPFVDAWLVQEATQDEEKVVLTLLVGNAGDAPADLSLEDQLPDVRRTWFLGGEDAASCVLDEGRLSCWFTDVAPGDSRLVELRAYTDRMPCGFSQTNTATVFVDGDMESRNDASSASILARAC